MTDGRAPTLRGPVREVLVRRVFVTGLILLVVGLVPAAGSADATVERAEGPGRVLTAVELSRRAFPTAGSAAAAIVARAGDFADALAAAPLAVAANGPVLLNPREDLHDDVRAEIERLGADTVYLMGGTAAQSQEVEDDLRSMDGVTVVRVEDPDHGDRFGTAAEAARLAVDLWGGAAGDHVLVTLGAHPEPSRAWPDALSAGQLAGHARRPILLVTPDGVPQVTNDTLAELSTSTVTVIGGSGAIPDDVMGDLAAPNRRRIGGVTRFDTARRVAEAAVAAGASDGLALVATGTNYADGLAAGPVAVHLGGVLLLVAPGHLADSPHAHDWFADRKSRLDTIVIAGGTGAVSAQVADHLDAATTDLANVSLRWEPVVSGLDDPLGVEFAPGDARAFVVERGGRIFATYPDGGKQLFLDIEGRVKALDEPGAGQEQGLLGLAFHPAYGSNGRFFVYYTRAGDSDATWLSEFRAVGGVGDETSEVRLDRYVQVATNHNGGGLEFGPDGMLYLALGDGGGSTGNQNGQDRSSELGSLLRYRIGVAHGDWTAPGDNPFAGSSSGSDLIWHYGLRNPFRFSFDPIDGLLLIGDVGASTQEEIDAVPTAASGVNFGWDVWEGTSCRRDFCDPSGYVFPVHEYATGSDGSCAVTGGVVYRGYDLPELAGTYLYGDHCEGTLRSLRVTDAGDAAEIRSWPGVGAGNPADFGVDHGGEVYVADLGGRLLKLVRG